MQRHLLAALVIGLVAVGCDGTTTVDPTPTPAPTVTVTATEFVPAPAATAVPADTCADFVDGPNHAFVFVTSPAPGTIVQPGFTFTGCSNAFEATHSWRLKDAQGAVIANGFGTATCGTGCVGTFQQTVNYVVSSTQVGSLEVFTSSAQDGSEVDLNIIPLVLQP